MQRTVTAVFIKKEKILLEKRKKDEDNYADCWALPGGHIEKDETAEHALIREMKEELNINITKYEFIGKFKDIDPTSKEEYEHNAFLCKNWTNLIKETSEQETIKWFSLIEFKNIPKHLKVDEDIIKKAKK